MLLKDKYDYPHVLFKEENFGARQYNFIEQPLRRTRILVAILLGTPGNKY